MAKQSKQSEAQVASVLAEWPKDKEGVELPVVEVDSATHLLIHEIKRDNHPDLNPFAIGGVFVKKAPNRAGKSTVATLMKPSPVYRMLSGFDAVIKIGWEDWSALDVTRRQAILDQELCRLDVHPETGLLRTVAPDFSGFRDNLARYGLWSAELESAKQSMMQMPIPFAAPDRKGNGHEAHATQ
jgi:hypothetical protein